MMDQKNDARRRRVMLGMAGLITPLATTAFGTAWAQPLPTPRLTRLIVPFAPGGVLDSLARGLAERTQERLGPVQVDNRVGLRGSVGTEMVAKAAPDGATLLLGSVVTHAINPWLGANKLYDPVHDFTPITLLARIPNVLLINAERAQALGIEDVASLVAYARKNPGRLRCGSSGMGTTSQLAAELLRSRTRINFIHQPYAGANPSLRGLLSGEVDFGFQNLASAAPGLKTGKLRALAVSTARRSMDLPDLPTISESPPSLGLAGFDIGIWFGLFGPPRMTPELTQKLNSAFIEALSTPDLRERLYQLRAEAAPSTPEQLAALVRIELARHEQLVKRSGATLE